MRAELPIILATRSDVLSPRMLRIIEELVGDWRRLDERIEGPSQEIEALARQDPACERLMTVPDIGPIISSAMVAAIGNGAVFAKGRDFGACLGLVPKQISTGDRTILEAISRRGNRYLRALFVQAAWVVLVRIKDWDRYGLKAWIDAAKKRLHHNVLAIALANKLARIAWAVLNRGPRVRMREDARDGVPTCMSVAQCSEPSRPSPAGGRTERPVLTALCAVPRSNCGPGRRNGPNGTNKGTAPKRKIAIM